MIPSTFRGSISKDAREDTGTAAKWRRPRSFQARRLHAAATSEHVAALGGTYADTIAATVAAKEKSALRKLNYIVAKRHN